ncbi:MAG: hypothetical protein EPO68_12680 [Planctomycetota bacterium]|nr:MAG: hypothetical protein EPO68_12680 [Planctomycetota bacterium]
MRALALALALGGALAAQSAVLQSAQPRELAVGEPLTLTIRVEHAPGESVALLGLADALGVGWAELSQSLRRSEVAPQTEALRATELELVLAPLESGELELPRLYVELSGGADPFSLPVTSAGDPPRIAVSAALAEGEDAPRELRPLQGDAFAGELDLSDRWALIGSAVALVGGGALLYFVQRARRRERAIAARPDAFERLTALAAAPAQPDGSALAHELAALLRDGVSELCPGLRVARTSAARAALTDEEFIASLDPSAPERERLSGLFLRLQAARWAGASGSAWARDAWIAETRECLEALRARGLRGAVLAERAEAVA